MAKGVSADSAESIEFYTGDGLSFSILNDGIGKTFAFELWSMSTAGGVIVEADNVSLSADALCTIVPNWSDPALHDIKLLIDSDLDGTYDDSLSLNVVTSVDDDEHASLLLYQFELAQNYPNPFNPVTTIINTKRTAWRRVCA